MGGKAFSNCYRCRLNKVDAITVDEPGLELMSFVFYSRAVFLGGLQESAELGSNVAAVLQWLPSHIHCQFVHDQP